jgi:hypothetical protein
VAPVPVSPYDGLGNATIFDTTILATTLYLSVLVFAAEKAVYLIAGIAGLAVLFAAYVGNSLIDLVNDRLFLDPMYEVQYECYLPIYGKEPEWCTFVVYQDYYSRKFLVTIYDSQGEIVGVWTRDQYGQIVSGWMMAGGKYVIYNPETGEWEDAPEGWEPGTPLPSQS